jgi:ABC-2 type transport system ATP-binding protein
MTRAESGVELHEIRRSFGDDPAVAGLSLRVSAGEIYGLVGPDGAGKTTTLRVAAGLMLPDGGTVAVAGHDPFDARGAHRELLGYMPQQYSLYGDLSVAENIAFFGEMYGMPRPLFRERRDRLLAMTRLSEFRGRRAEALSGGMYKKLALVCALLHRPRVLLLDEPTTGVDPVSRRELWDLLGEFVAEGMAIVLATPYMDEAARCHRAGMLHRGALLLEGTPSELLGAFPHKVFSVSGDRDALEDVLVSDGDVLAFTPAGARLRMVVREGREAEVLAHIGAAGGRAEPTGASFEDLFLASMRDAGGAS